MPEAPCFVPWGYPPIGQLDPWVGKGHRDKPLWKWFQETVSALSNKQPRRQSNCTCIVTYIAEAMDCDGSAPVTELDSEHSYHPLYCSMQEKHTKGDRKIRTHMQASFQLLRLLQNPVFLFEEHGQSCFLCRSAVCQVD